MLEVEPTLRDAKAPPKTAAKQKGDKKIQLSLHPEAPAEIPLPDLKVGGFLIVRDPNGDKAWNLGRIVEIDSDGTGAFTLRYYGTYDVKKPIGNRRFRPAWYHERGKKLTYESNCKTANTVPERFTVEADDILVSKVEFKPTKNSYVLSKETVARLEASLASTYFTVLRATITGEGGSYRRSSKILSSGLTCFLCAGGQASAAVTTWIRKLISSFAFRNRQVVYHYPP